MTTPPQFGQQIAQAPSGATSGASLLSGLSSETKPTDVDAGSIFLETDTGLSFTFSGTVWTRVGAGGQLGALASPRWTTPGWMINDRAALNTTSGRILYVPIFVARRTTYDRIGIEVDTSPGASLIRLGIYDSLDDLPNNLVVDAGTIDSSTTGSKEIVISETLDRGFYFTAAIANAVVGVLGIDINRFISAPVGGSGATVDERHADHIYVSGFVGDVAGGLQDPARAPTTAARERNNVQLRS